MKTRRKSQPEPVHRPLVAALRLFAALFLALCLVPQPAASAEIASPPLPASAASSPADDPSKGCDDGIDASHPPAPGQTAKVIGDDEIFLAYRYESTGPYLRQKVINFNTSTNKLTTLKDEGWSSDAKLSGTWWLTAAAGDLNGTADNKRVDRMVAGFQNKDGQVDAIADAVADSMADKNWWCQYSSNDSRCDNATQMDIATGNLDMSADASDEIAIFYRDNDDDYMLMTLDGGSDGTISTAADTWVGRYNEDQHPGRERGDVNHFAIATGDLNGDGFDNEMVTVEKDSGKDLQVSVHRGMEATEIFYWDSYYGNPKLDTVADACDGYGNFRPMDVATGDVDGDLKDEAIVATKFGGCTDARVRLLVFDFKDEDPTTHKLTIDTTVAVTNVEWPVDDGTEHSSYKGIPDISISAADLDGDGYDEIAVGYTRHFYSRYALPSEGYVVDHALVAYQYFRTDTPQWEEHCAQPATLLDSKLACLYRYTNIWGSEPDFKLGSDTDYYGRMWLAAGDVDADGVAEVAMSRIAKDKSAQVILFRANTNTLSAVDTLTITTPDGYPVHEPPIAMGDFDGDSKWGTYANRCNDKKEAVVQALIQAPPLWPNIPKLNSCENDWAAEAEFAAHYGTRNTTEEDMETTIGGSTTTSKEAHGITGLFSREWERNSYKSESVSKQTTGGNTTWTVSRSDANDSNEEPYLAGVLTIEDTQYCYDYNVTGLDPSHPTTTEAVPVCVYQPDRKTFLPLSLPYWYEEEGGRADYLGTWTPVGANLAQDTTQTLRKATQSSTWTNGSPTGDAYRALDGNTDGAYADKSVTSTNVETNPWWQVDMGGLQWIDAIQIWNRTDANVAGRTKNYYVLTTTDPKNFQDASLETLLSNSNVWHHFEADEAGTPTTITVQQYARVVRVQLDTTGTNGIALNLAEVQVYGRPATPDQWPRAVASAGEESFKLTWRTSATSTIANTVSRPLHVVVEPAISVTKGSLPQGFTTGAGDGLEQLSGYGKSKSFTVGMESKRERLPSKARDFSIGYEQKTSNATSWERDVEFGGQVSGLPSKAVGLNYSYTPYIWSQAATPEGGGTVEYLVMDYTVADGVNALPEDGPPSCAVTTGAPLPIPQAPVITSPTHPDPDAWNTSSAVTFNWSQPSEDPATVAAYVWLLDKNPDTIPPGFGQALTNTTSYPGVNDGTWYMHVRGMNANQQWGPTGHRRIQVDAGAPEVSLTLDPPDPTGHSGWYITPVNATVTAADMHGSGVQGVEYSLDGVTWQPNTMPVQLGADTPGTTIYARATDAVGSVSKPVSTTIKIDRTPPDSHVAGGAGPGTLVAEVTTDGAGNQAVALAGAISDNLSGRAGMILEEQGTRWGVDAGTGSWHPLPDPAIEVNWYYTATHQLGAGYHIFTGSARDEAGNLEEAYEIARLVVPPQASPDLSGSTVAASQQTARPGDEIMLTLVGRNAGFEEAHVTIADTLPVGLDPVLAALPDGVTYDATTRTLTWPSRPVWPGQRERRNILTRVDPTLGSTVLENKATFHAFWPNTDLLPEAEQKPFLDREQTLDATTRIVVDPKVAAGADLVAPWVIALAPSRTVVTGPEVSLSITAAPDAQHMYLREWAPDPVTGAWKVMQNSGWIDFSPTYTWKLSTGQGVRYMGVWVADAAGNISTLEEPAMPFVNRVDENQVLAGGQRIQYRALLDMGNIAWVSMKTVSGDPDLYAWGPHNAFWPDRSANATLRPGDSDELATDSASGSGRYILEVQAAEASEYDLSFPGTGSEIAAGAAGLAVTKPRPEHPLTVSDPLSSGELGPVVTLGNKSYLPLIFRDN